MSSLTSLKDDELLAALGELVRSHRDTTSAIVAHLAEVDTRRLYAPLGFPSLFQYCMEELHFSEDEACRRIDVARIARGYHVVLEMLRTGDVSLSVVMLLKNHLTHGNHAELLAGVTTLSARRAKEWIAARFPRPDVQETIRKLPTPPPARWSVCATSFAIAAPAGRRNRFSKWPWPRSPTRSRRSDSRR